MHASTTHSHIHKQLELALPYSNNKGTKKTHTPGVLTKTFSCDIMLIYKFHCYKDSIQLGILKKVIHQHGAFLQINASKCLESYTCRVANLDLHVNAYRHTLPAKFFP